MPRAKEIFPLAILGTPATGSQSMFYTDDPQKCGTRSQN